MEEEKRKQIIKQAKPFWLTNFYIDRPCVTLAICLSVMLICTIVTIFSKWVKLSSDGDRDFHIWDNAKVKDKDMYVEAEKQFLKTTQSQKVPKQSDKISDWETIIMLECRNKCDNVLTQEGINLMIKIEEETQKIKNYDKFCFKDQKSNEKCSSDTIISFTNLLKEEFKERNIKKLSKQELRFGINSVFEEDNYEQYSYLFHKEFKKNNYKSRLLMTQVQFSGPIKNYKNRHDKFEKQEEEFAQFTRDFLKKIKEIKKDNKSKINILTYSGTILEEEFKSITMRDFSFAILSISFVWIYLSIHLKSSFLSTMAMLGVIFSFPMTFVIYMGILQVTFFQFLHILAIFIILGIAADDVFVYYDAWVQSGTYECLEGDKKKRMALTFRRASKAMLATSFTTSVSFLANVISPMMPIKSFGIFASILVPMNYLIVITFFPCLLIIQEKYFSIWCTCLYKKQKNPSNIRSSKEEQLIDQNQVYEEEGFLSKFLETKVNDFIFKFRWVIIGVTIGWIIAASILAAQMGPLKEMEKFIPDDHHIQRGMNYLMNDMHTSTKNAGQYIPVTIFWGTSDLNTKEVKQWESSFPGDLIWDSKFTLAPQENQLFIYNLCKRVQRKKFFLKNRGEIKCFMLQFKEWLELNSRSFPVQEEQFDASLVEFLKSPLGLPHYYSQNVGYFNNKLHFVGIDVPSTGDPTGGYSHNQKNEKKWQNFIDQQNKIAPQGLQNGKQQSEVWAFMITQKELVKSVISGIFISLAFAWLTMVLFTFNIIISCYSVLAISGIIVSVIAVMECAGYSLGISESLSIVVLIGMSVDYVVHLANHYVESSHQDRFNRTKESLKEIGVSIISGGITTLGAGCMLFFAVITLFVKFALLIVTTVSFSFYFSMVFFTALTHIIGPQGDQGHIIKMFQKKDQNINRDSQDSQFNESQQTSININ